jgi:hypothetical protein
MRVPETVMSVIPGAFSVASSLVFAHEIDLSWLLDASRMFPSSSYLSRPYRTLVIRVGLPASALGSYPRTEHGVDVFPRCHHA